MRGVVFWRLIVRSGFGFSTKVQFLSRVAEVVLYLNGRVVFIVL